MYRANLLHSASTDKSIFVLPLDTIPLSELRINGNHVGVVTNGIP